MKKASNKRSPRVSGARVVAPRDATSRDATSRDATSSQGGGLRPHYDFDYSHAKPNRFAARFGEGAVVVVLEPDVANVFHSSEAVNKFLRSAIAAMPQGSRVAKRRGQ
jgi:hypothetical protein